MANSQTHKPQIHKSHTSKPASALESNKIEPPVSQEYLEVNAAIERGLADIAAGRIHTRRSYAEYADLEIED